VSACGLAPALALRCIHSGESPPPILLALNLLVWIAISLADHTADSASLSCSVSCSLALVMPSPQHDYNSWLILAPNPVKLPPGCLALFEGVVLVADPPRAAQRRRQRCCQR